MTRIENRLSKLVQRLKRRNRLTIAGFLVLFAVMLPLGAWGASSVITLMSGDTVSVRSGDGCRIREDWDTRYRVNLRCGSTTSSSTSSSTSTSTSTTSSTTTTTTTTLPPDPDGTQPPSLVTGGAQWAYIFNEDFDGTAVNTTRWNVQNNSTFGDSNNEEQTYMAANVTVSNGTVKLFGNTQTLDSGMITTRQQGGPLKFKYRHGYAEVRMRAPGGAPYWPAFWLVGASDGSSPGWPAYGEFDVSEIYGPRPASSESNFHYGTSSSPQRIGARAHNVGSTLDWHTYGFNWTASKIEWFIDGVLVRSHTASGSSQIDALGYEHGIILNLAIGGNGPEYYGYQNGTSENYPSGNLEIDYVKVWQP